MTMTVKSVITWKPESDVVDEQLYQARADKLTEMLAEGKTTGNYLQVGPNTYTRYFIDEAAAQEYIDAMKSIAAQYGKEILSASIEPADHLL